MKSNVSLTKLQLKVFCLFIETKIFVNSFIWLLSLIDHLCFLLVNNYTQYTTSNHFTDILCIQALHFMLHPHIYVMFTIIIIHIMFRLSFPKHWIHKIQHPTLIITVLKLFRFPFYFPTRSIFKQMKNETYMKSKSN